MCHCTDLKQRIKDLEHEINLLNSCYFATRGLQLSPFLKALDKSNSGIQDILRVLKKEVLFELYDAAIRIILFVLAKLKNRGIAEEEFKLHYETIANLQQDIKPEFVKMVDEHFCSEDSFRSKEGFIIK